MTRDDDTRERLARCIECLQYRWIHDDDEGRCSDCAGAHALERAKYLADRDREERDHDNQS